ncbi:Villin-1 [Thalictrum thalictroides]|uniref:Villin-1 n=1 Tax=Thalictrum thalictroides TaxID=46969 RepID=A0A7J6VUB3_THATH|nr:Villin-1 [Thalictrum thalictroides]
MKQANKVRKDNVPATTANVAVQTAVGQNDILLKWQLMAKQARQKCEDRMLANEVEEDGVKWQRMAANNAVRTAVGGDDMLLKWQLMADQAQKKCEGRECKSAQPTKDENQAVLSTSIRHSRDSHEHENKNSVAARTTPSELLYNCALLQSFCGLEIWCIENLQVVTLPKSSYGKFFSGSAYIVLNTVLLKSGVFQHDVHYWLGKDAEEADSATASDKALELDAALGSQAVQYKEVQGYETEKFLSYFKPCIIPIVGVFSSELEVVSSMTYPVSLLTCKGDRVIYVKEVPFSRSSLNHNNVFILDTASKIFLFSGCNSSIQERAKALEVVQYIKENKHNGRCEVSTIEDGKFVGDPDVGEFWSLFGGYAPITREQPCTTLKQPEVSPVKLFWITLQGQLSQIGTGSLKKQMLSQDKCYMLDCGTEIYVWMGNMTSITERKIFISATENMLNFQDRSIGTHITFLTEGSETSTFKSLFDDWPKSVQPNLYEEGRGKVAAIFKQHGYDVKELPEEHCKPFINCSGTLMVWRVDSKEVFLQGKEPIKLFSGDCYIVRYTYAGIEKDENVFYAWLGRNSIEEDRDAAISKMSNMADSIKGHPVLAQILEGMEPMQFYHIYQTLIVCKGGTSSRYKRSISENEITDETYNEDTTALFRVQGSSRRNIQAIEVDLVSGSLNSSYCYILQAGTSIFTWAGNLTSPRDHDLLDRMLDLINQTTHQPTSVREGSEPDVFWSVLGGRTEYPKEKEMKSYVEFPHLFTCICKEASGNLEVKEIFNFTQDDLTTEDVLVLDCHNEIYVWIGNHANVRSNQQALTLGMKFLQIDILLEGLSMETPIYVVREGHEPSFFTCFFEWDSSKARMHGNSFERKLAILKGHTSKKETPKRSPQKSFELYSAGATSYSSSNKYLSPNKIGRSVSPSSCDFKSSSDVPSTRDFANASHSVRKLFATSSLDRADTSYGASLDLHSREITEKQVVSQTLESSSDMKIGSLQDESSEVDDTLETFPYECLQVMSDDPLTSIDVTKREAYLSHAEFQEKFGMTKKVFYKLPKWRQNEHKRSLNLF